MKREHELPFSFAHLTGRDHMSLAKKLQPRLASLLTSPRTRNTLRQLQEAKRRLGAQPHAVSVWLRADDPYSYLLVQVLPRFVAHFDVTLQVHIINRHDEATTPAPDELAAYARRDAALLARRQALDFPDHAAAPDQADTDLATRLLVAHAHQSPATFLPLARQVLAALWRGYHKKLATLVTRFPPAAATAAARQLDDNLRHLQSLGHYQPAMLHYGGEWYWGIDRLSYLAERLQGLGAARATHDFVLNDTPLPGETGQAANPFLISDPADLATLRALHLPLEFYFSFRSPYSYLALPRVLALTDHYGLDLRIRPVLPMVMRGLPVPREKRLYILADAAREAERLGIPFGRVCDPVGEGVERCMALFPAAMAAGRAGDFLLSVATGIWSEGADVSRDADLGKRVTAAGLDWQALAPRLRDTAWHAMARDNREALTGLGLWGVPVLHLQTPAGDCAVWGQDRLWALEDALADVLPLSASPAAAGGGNLSS